MNRNGDTREIHLAHSKHFFFQNSLLRNLNDLNDLLILINYTVSFRSGEINCASTASARVLVSREGEVTLLGPVDIGPAGESLGLKVKMKHDFMPFLPLVYHNIIVIDVYCCDYQDFTIPIPMATVLSFIVVVVIMITNF